MGAAGGLGATGGKEGGLGEKGAALGADRGKMATRGTGVVRGKRGPRDRVRLRQVDRSQRGVKRLSLRSRRPRLAPLRDLHPKISEQRETTTCQGCPLTCQGRRNRREDSTMRGPKAMKRVSCALVPLCLCDHK